MVWIWFLSKYSGSVINPIKSSLYLFNLLNEVTIIPATNVMLQISLELSKAISARWILHFWIINLIYRTSIWNLVNYMYILFNEIYASKLKIVAFLILSSWNKPSKKDILLKYRPRRPIYLDMCFKKEALKSFAKFVGKNTYWSPFLINLKDITLLKGESCFPVTFSAFSKKNYFVE